MDAGGQLTYCVQRCHHAISYPAHACVEFAEFAAGRTGAKRSRYREEVRGTGFNLPHERANTCVDGGARCDGIPLCPIHVGGARKFSFHILGYEAKRLGNGGSRGVVQGANQTGAEELAADKGRTHMTFESVHRGPQESDRFVHTPEVYPCVSEAS